MKTSLVATPGQRRLAQVGDRLVANGRLPAALVLLGPAETTLNMAYAFAARLLCEQPQERSLPVLREGEDPIIIEDACGRCPNCLGITQGTHPDVTVLPTAKVSAQLDVDTIRETIVAEVYQSPLQASHRVFIIPDAERLHRNRGAAANALLKVLEEPASKSVIILTAHGSESLLPTIRSRVQQFRCDPIEGAAKEAAPLARLHRLLEDGLQPAVIAALIDELPTDAGTEGTPAKNQRATLERWLVTLLDDLRRDLRGGRPREAVTHIDLVYAAIADCRRNFQPRQVLEAMAVRVPEDV